MKKYLFFIAASMTLAFTSCDNADDKIESAKDFNKGFTFNAVLPQQPASTRLAAADNGTYVTFSWSSDNPNNRDLIRFHYQNADASDAWFQVNRLPTISDNKATFSLTQTPKENSYVYGCNHTNYKSKYNDASSALFLIDPRDHIFNNLDDLGKCNPMLGVIQKSDKSIPNTMYFKNICALLKFTITLPVTDKNVTEIKISDYYSSAPHDFTYGRWAVQFNSDGTYSYNGVSGGKPVDGSTANAQSNLNRKGLTWATTSGTITFYAVILPQDISGIQLEVTVAGGAKYTKHTQFASTKTLTAGKMYTINLTNSEGWGS